MSKEVEILSTYCPNCDMPVEARLVECDETLRVKGEPTPYRATLAICPECGEAIGDSRVESRNLRAAYSAYASSHGVLTPDEIRSLRARYGLSVREFSRFLGFGDQTIARYESGSLPDETHNTTLRVASTAEGASLLLDVRRDSLSPHTVAAVESFVASESVGSRPWSSPASQWPPVEMMSPNPDNGYRGFDWARICAVALELAARCHDLYKTKLQKAMFFVDYVCFARTSRSMTGLAYAHADYGPVIDGRERVVGELVNLGVIGLEQRGWGEVVVPVADGGRTLSRAELDLIDEVARFVDTFGSAGEISDFSHSLDAWAHTSSGEIIGYPDYAEQVEDRVRERLVSQG